MGQNKKKQHQLKRLFQKQRGKCHWCGAQMIPPGGPKGGGRQDPLLCTYDHGDSRLSSERGKHGGEYRNVAACWTCNNIRNKHEQETIPKEKLWEKSGAYPLAARVEADARADAGDGLRGERRTTPSLRPSLGWVLRLDEHRARENASDIKMETGSDSGSMGASG